MRRLGLVLLAATSAGCRRPPQLEQSELSRSIGRNEMELRRVGDQLGVAQEIARLRSLPPKPVTVVASPELASLPLDSIEAAATRLWSRARGEGGLSLVISLVQPDDSSRFGLGPGHFSGVVLPDQVGSKHCLVVIGGREPRIKLSALPLDRVLAELMAPCLFFERYGRPGPAVGTWLSTTGYQAIKDPSAVLSSTHWAPLWRGGLQGEELAEYAAEQSLLPPLVLMAVGDRVPPYLAGTSGVGCLAGRAPDCGRTITDSVVARPFDQWAGPLGPGIVRTYSPFGWMDRDPLNKGTWLSRLVAGQGERRFAAFWHASGSVTDAFRATYGLELGPSVKELVRQELNRLAVTDPIRLGPTVTGGTVLATVGWLGLVLLLPLLGAARRVVGR